MSLIGLAVGTRRQQLARTASPLNAGPGTGKPSQAIESLTKYIPTEIITLYVAALAAYPLMKQLWSPIQPMWIYYTFALLTFVGLALAYWAAGVTSDRPSLISFWWNAFASVAAFLVWALAVPGLLPDAHPLALLATGFGAVLISSVLGRIEVFLRKVQAIP